MMRMRITGPFAVLMLGSLALFSCGTGSQPSEQPAVEANLDSLQQARMEELQKIFFSIPAPMEMASLIKGMGYSYDGSLLNPVEGAMRYTGEVSQAVNLGIYGADLSYASMFEQRQETMNYLAAAQRLAREMGVDGALNDEVIERLQANQDSRDSLLKIVSEAYADLNGYLKENNRIEVSALVVAGGWIEALYLSTRYTEKDNPELNRRIAEQKYSLTNLITYFNEFGEQEKLNGMKADLASLQALFDRVKIGAGNTELKKEADGVVVIGNQSTVDMSPETLKEIATKVAEIRKKYTA
ncbi:MAG: hypothetical protein ACK505_00415 [Flavobacteriales bacterium]